MKSLSTMTRLTHPFPAGTRRCPTTPRAFMIFGVIVLAVGIGVMVIPNLYWIADRIAPGFFDDGD